MLFGRSVMEDLIAFLGFWPALFLGLLAYWLGKKSRITAILGVGFGVAVLALGIAFAVSPYGRDMVALVYLAYGLCGAVFAGVTLVSYLYHSGVLGRLLTPKRAK